MSTRNPRRTHGTVPSLQDEKINEQEKNTVNYSTTLIAVILKEKMILPNKVPAPILYFATGLKPLSALLTGSPGNPWVPFNPGMPESPALPAAPCYIQCTVKNSCSGPSEGYSVKASGA